MHPTFFVHFSFDAFAFKLTVQQQTCIKSIYMSYCTFLKSVSYYLYLAADIGIFYLMLVDANIKCTQVRISGYYNFHM